MDRGFRDMKFFEYCKKQMPGKGKGLIACQAAVNPELGLVIS